ncbi:MAG: M15 family metallopeptidase [Clostridia bacterium]|nr:M15 family metallopeptidase [Clostridia bacterium]
MRIIALLLSAVTLISLFACTKSGTSAPHDTTVEESTTLPDTTVPDTTDAETTTEEITTEEITTVEITTAEPQFPIYGEDEYTYNIDVSKYLSYIDPENDEEYLIIANRKHPLGKDYKPSNLTYVAKGQSWLLRRAAKEAFEAMRLEMQYLGVYDTYNRSTYRSYSFQNTLYNNYIERDKKRYPNLSHDEIVALVDTYSARPGTSDHQTGLTIDFDPLNESFEDLKAFAYMRDNAYKFGFILRYPKGKENITGYKYEPWHWRFVGRDAATYIYEHGITLEEYMAKKNGTEIEYFD